MEVQVGRAVAAEAFVCFGRGKSELRRAVRRVTPGQGNLKDSGTENIPPCEGGVILEPFFAGKGEKVR